MPSLLGPIMSGAVLCFFRGAQVQKLQKLSLQLNVCHHEMLLMLKIHVSLQRETNACGQRNKRMYSAPTKKSCLSEKQSTGRDLFWANLLRLICKVLAHAKKIITGHSSGCNLATAQSFIHRWAKLKNFVSSRAQIEKHVFFPEDTFAPAKGSSVQLYQQKIFRLMHMICCTRGNKHGMFNVTNKQTKVTYKGRGYFSQLF